METTVLITGGNVGIGKETVRGLAREGAHVVIACRNQKTGQEAREEIRAQTGRKNVDLMRLDLSSQGAIREFAAEFKKTYGKLDVLINNAGVYPQKLEKTADGFEAQFGVNYLGHFLLTNLLLDSLRKAGKARVVNVASMMHWLGNIRFESFRGPRRYGAFPAYAQSKLANILFSNELARRMKGTGVTSNALHPGAIKTGLYDEIPGWMLLPMKPILVSTEKGSRNSIFLAASPKVEGVTGKYFVGTREAAASPRARNRALAEKLWRESESLCGL